MADLENIDRLKKDLDDEVEFAIEDIILNYLRPIKLEMYECTANCLNDDATENEAKECMVGCYEKTASIMWSITHTFNDFKRRVRTCLKKCDNGSGYNPQEDDDEGSDEGIPAEELAEETIPGMPGPDNGLESIFDEITSDLEHEQEDKQLLQEMDLKDKNVCTRLCLESYINTLTSMIDQMRRDVAATFLAKTDEQDWYYEWSKSQTAKQI